MVEDPVHHGRARLKDGPDLLAVHELGHCRAAVTYQPRDLLERHTVVGQEGDEAMPQLPGGSVLSVHAHGACDRVPEVAAHM